MKIFIITAGFIWLSMAGALRAEPSHLRCYKTVGVNSKVDQPKMIPNQNRLVPVTFQGQRLAFDVAGRTSVMVAGRVVSKGCVPIAGARVVLYHRDHERPDVTKETTVVEPAIWSGEVYTDNLGEFAFFTHLPEAAFLPDDAFVMTAKVSHVDYQNFESALFLPETEVDLPTHIKNQLVADKYVSSQHDLPVFGYEITLGGSGEPSREF